MKIKMKNKELTELFTPSLVYISKLPTNSKVSYNIVKTLKSVNEVNKDIDSTRINILESRCLKDDKGKPKENKGLYVFESLDIEKECSLILDNLKEAESEIDIFKINSLDLSNVNIPANILINLEKFINVND